jgi:hypothetical protein
MFPRYNAGIGKVAASAVPHDRKVKRTDEELCLQA